LSMKSKQTLVAYTKFNPDSAIGADRKHDAQSFRSEVDRFLLCADHRSALLSGDA
jgi:hypothetical protein